MLGFKHAIKGVVNMVKSEKNFKIQLGFLVTIIFLGIFFNISTFEWITILLTSALVLSLESINSAVEKLCDLVSIEQHASIKWIKDVSAGAVLIASICSLIIGGLIFIPKLICFFD